MAKFTVRVELHDEESGDYPKLQKQMEKRGFERTLNRLRKYLPAKSSSEFFAASPSDMPVVSLHTAKCHCGR